MSEHNHKHEHNYEHEHNHGHDHEHCHDEACGCGHDHHHEAGKLQYVLISLSLILLLISFIPLFEGKVIFIILTVLSALLSGYEAFFEGLMEIRHLKIGEHFLLLVAVCAAFAIGEMREAAAVSFFFALGEIFEGLASEKSEKSIRELSKIKPDKANALLEDGNYKTVDAQAVEVGDKIVVLPFERVPVDCRVIDGEGTVDASAITGESLPVEVYPGKEVFSGSLNGEAGFTAVVLKKATDSVASRIVEIAKNNAKTKGEKEKFISRFAKYYTPIVIALGVILAVVPSFITGNPLKWIKSGLVFIVASCPCALVISIPLSFFSGIGLASKNAIIIKGGKYIENLTKIKAVCFDKTGTLTDGKLNVGEMKVYNNYLEKEVKRYAFDAEMSSSHPIALAIKEFCGETDDVVSSLKEYPGQGVSIEVENKKILCGGKRLMTNNNIKIQEDYPVYVAVDGELAGAFAIESNVKEDSVVAVQKLKENNINHLFMLTGDNEKNAKLVSEKCGLSGYFAELLPERKAEKLKEIQGKYGPTLYVGDGINDAPVIALSDVGVAMGLGSQAAVETADMVLMSEKVSDINKAIKISKATMKTVYFNIIFALAVKAIVLLLAAFGFAFMALAVFADVGVSIIAIINSSRLLKKRI